MAVQPATKIWCRAGQGVSLFLEEGPLVEVRLTRNISEASFRVLAAEIVTTLISDELESQGRERLRFDVLDRMRADEPSSKPDLTNAVVGGFAITAAGVFALRASGVVTHNDDHDAAIAAIFASLLSIGGLVYMGSNVRTLARQVMEIPELRRRTAELVRRQERKTAAMLEELELPSADRLNTVDPDRLEEVGGKAVLKLGEAMMSLAKMQASQVGPSQIDSFDAGQIHYDAMTHALATVASNGLTL